MLLSRRVLAAVIPDRPAPRMRTLVWILLSSGADDDGGDDDQRVAVRSIKYFAQELKFTRNMIR